MRRIVIDEHGRQPVVIIEGMPADASLQYLGRSMDLLYMVEHGIDGMKLYIGEQMRTHSHLTQSHVRRSFSSADIGAHLMDFSHERARGELFFNHEGTKSFIYRTDLQGAIIGCENLATVLPSRPRDVPFADIRYAVLRIAGKENELRL